MSLSGFKHFLISGTARWQRYLFHFLCPILRTSHSSKEPEFFLIPFLYLSHSMNESLYTECWLLAKHHGRTEYKTVNKTGKLLSLMVFTFSERKTNVIQIYTKINIWWQTVLSSLKENGIWCNYRPGIQKEMSLIFVFSFVFLPSPYLNRQLFDLIWIICSYMNNKFLCLKSHFFQLSSDFFFFASSIDTFLSKIVLP